MNNSELKPPAPYIIQIRNTSGLAVNNVDIGDSFTNRSSSNYGQSDSIAITSTVPGVTYLEYLAQTESQPFLVGLTMVISSTSGQVERNVQVAHRNALGDGISYSLAAVIDPYQHQTDRVIDNHEYMMDGMTRLRIARIAAGATVTVRQYPKNTFDAAQIVIGNIALQNYQNPNVIKTFADL